MKKILFISVLSLTALDTLADDTEVYLNATSETTVRPNIMILMDTSGSMAFDSATPPDLPDYNSSITYTGNYDSALYYTGSEGDYGSVPINCSQLATSIESTGIRTGSVIAQYNFFGWFRGYRCDDGGTLTRSEERVTVTIFDGNYLNHIHPPRIKVARQAFEVVVNSLDDNVNLGLMHFGPSTNDNANGGTIDVPISPIENVRTTLIDTVNDYDPDGGTPLAEAVHEAMLYFSGGQVKYGSQSHDGVFTDPSKSNYRSPITDECQTNHLVMFTDGVASTDSDTDSDIRTLFSALPDDKPSNLSSTCSHRTNRDGDLLETCLEELAFVLNKKDFSPLDEIQNITLYTIGGFDLDQTEFLENTAALGGGQYQAANSASEISSSLINILNDIVSNGSTFTAPAVSVNAFNASEHRDEVFYALFQPEKRSRWPGNVKKYRLNSNGILVGQDASTPAIDENTGFFKPTSTELWNNTDEADGNNVQRSGFARLLNAENRNVLTESNTGALRPIAEIATNALYGLSDEEDDEVLNNLVQWTRGFDVNNEDGNENTNTRFAISDPLHSEPLIITYGGTSVNPDATLFFGTNAGFIHALSTNTGVEQFAYLPSELMINQPLYYTNTQNAANRPYGMDGPITTWINDKNHNNVLYNSEGVLDADEHAYIYAGMRRGGNKYYALDVTNRSTPSLKFIIRGGQGQFTKLGQTWSKAIVTKVKLPGQSEEKVVLIFSGGYDENQDNNETRSADSIGNAIYMVDAETGQRLWWASSENADLTISSMTNSMPASPTPVDINDDGLVDYLFAADTGGRIFRIDFDHKAADLETFATGGRIADLSENNEANNRRFYNQPSVSLVQDKQLGDHLSIAIGSGHRAKPVSNTVVADRMYIIKDRAPYQAPENYLTITEADEDENGSGLQPSDAVDRLKVYNATAIMNGGTAALTSQLKRLITEGGGFYVTFANTGEKVLSRALTFSGAVMFTTFSPNGENTSTCGPDVGQSRLYVIDQKWGIPVLDLDNDGEVNVGDASTSLAHAGIAPRPVVIYRSGGKKSIAIGTETFDDHRFDPTSSVVNKLRSDDQPDSECNYSNCNVKPIYWRQNEKDFSYASSSGESE